MNESYCTFDVWNIYNAVSKIDFIYIFHTPKVQ